MAQAYHRGCHKLDVSKVSASPKILIAVITWVFSFNYFRTIFDRCGVADWTSTLMSGKVLVVKGCSVHETDSLKADCSALLWGRHRGEQIRPSMETFLGRNAR